MSEAKLNNEVHSANGWFQIAVASDGTTASIKKIVRHSGDGKPIKFVVVGGNVRHSGQMPRPGQGSQHPVRFNDVVVDLKALFLIEGAAPD